MIRPAPTRVFLASAESAENEDAEYFAHVPFAPLAAVIPPPVEGGIVRWAERAGVSPRTVHRWKRKGFAPFWSADRAVSTTGQHPALVWPVAYGFPPPPPAPPKVADTEVVLPGHCACGRRVVLVRDVGAVGFVWVNQRTGEPCTHDPEVDQ